MVVGHLWAIGPKSGIPDDFHAISFSYIFMNFHAFSSNFMHFPLVEVVIRRSIPVILIYFLAILVKIIYFGTSDELGGVHILLLKLRQSSTTSAWSCHLTRPRERKKCTQHYRALTLICSLSSRVLILFWCPGMSGCRCRVRRGTKPPN